MYWGQLITVRAKKEYKCVWCKEAIQAGREYWGLSRVIRGRGRVTSKVHKNDCFNRWINTQTKLRKERMGNRRELLDHNRNPAGRPKLEFSEEIALIRAKVLHNIVVKKSALTKAYIRGDQNDIRKLKLSLARYLREAAESPEYAPLPKFKWSKEFTALINAGMDSKLTSFGLTQAGQSHIQIAELLESSCD